MRGLMARARIGGLHNFFRSLRPQRKGCGLAVTMLARLTPAVLLGAAALAQAPNAPDNADWTRPFPAFRVIANIYWVGSYDLSTYLVTTPQGNILINTGVGDTAQQIG